MEIPKTLQDDRLRFCKIRKNTKKPFEQDWTNKPYTWKEIQEWLNKEDGNYGVLCGYGDLAVIDCDNIAFQDSISVLFPDTYKVKTGSGGTHNYFFIPDFKQKLILTLDDEKKTHLGEVQSQGQQVIGAGSIHPNGNKYSEINNLPITTISADLLFSILKSFMPKEIQETEDNADFERTNKSDIDSLSVASIWGKTGLKNRKGEYYGSHPIHSSSGGVNFWINPLKNTWHCFRCNSGGGALSAIAVKERIIDCSEARKGNLRGEKAAQAIQIAREKYGLEDSNMSDFKNLDGTYKAVLKNYDDKKEEIKVIWENELPNYVEEEKEWIIEKLIPTRSVCILTGKRGTMKTFVALNMAYSVASGHDFLNKYSVRKGGIIYLDKENGLGVMKERTNMIRGGLDIKTPLKIGFICFSQLKIDKPNDIGKIQELVTKEKPLLLFVDTYRRGISFDENDAGEVSKLFVDTLRPLIEKNDLSIILIHHDRKSGERDGDEMDTIRGSSDLANYADIILRMERKSNSLIMKQLKNRNAAEEQPIKICTNFDENKVQMWYEGEFIKKNQAQLCAEEIMKWIVEHQRQEFKTSEIKEFALIRGFKKNNLFNSLQELQEKGIISNVFKGGYKVHWEVIKDSRVIV